MHAYSLDNRLVETREPIQANVGTVTEALYDAHESAWERYYRGLSPFSLGRG